MGDLISRSAVIEYIKRDIICLSREGQAVKELIIKQLQKNSMLPSVEAVPVVHGEWVDNGIHESALSKCSVCGCLYGSSGFNFCPECGAKMDGKKTGHLVEIVRMIKDSGMSKEELERLFFGEEGVKNDK